MSLSFASDNWGPVPEPVLQALARANADQSPSYGGDDLTASVRDRLRALFEAPEAGVFLVASGTAANALSLATLCPPWGTVFCSDVAHIHEDECNAPEFYTGGAKLTLVRGGDRMAPDALRAAIAGEGNRGVHGPARGPVSITNVGEAGNVYTLDEMAALCAVAKEHGLPVHLDGARFANACVRLGCSPAEMTWKIGVDIAVFGGTKNGLMDVEAVIVFDPARAQEFAYRAKRGGHLYSKHRYLAAQMAAYLEGDLWRDLARRANGACDRLRAGLEEIGVEVVNPTHANMLFIRLPVRVHEALRARGAVYHAGPGAPEDITTGRLVCDWTAGARVPDFLDAVRAET